MSKLHYCIRDLNHKSVRGVTGLTKPARLVDRPTPGVENSYVIILMLKNAAKH